MKRTRWIWTAVLAVPLACGEEAESPSGTHVDALKAVQYAVGVHVDAYRSDGAACLMTDGDAIVCAVGGAPTGDGITLITGQTAVTMAGTMSPAAEFGHATRAEFEAIFDALGVDRYVGIVELAANGGAVRQDVRAADTSAVSAPGPGGWLRRVLRKLFKGRRRTRRLPRATRPWPKAEDCRLRSETLTDCTKLDLKPIYDSDGNVVAWYDQFGNVH